MKRVLLLASKAGYQTEAFAAAAARLGNIKLELATNRCHHLDDPWQDGALAVDFDSPVIEPQPWDGIAAVGDQAAVVAAVLAERFHLRFHPPEAVRACRSKFEMRQRFQAAGLLTPAFTRVAAPPAEVQFPCVLKPLGLSASRGVIRANNPQEFAEAFARIRRLLTRTPDLARDSQSAFIQIEEFIPGREFALEGLVTAGRLETLAIFDKPDPLDGPYFEETIYVTPSCEPVEIQQSITETMQKAITALGLTDGPIHAECRVNPQGVWLLEVAARPIGGLCARVLRSPNGEGLEEAILRHAVNISLPHSSASSLTSGADLWSAAGLRPAQESNVGPRPSLRLKQASAVMMIPIPRAGIYQSVQGIDKAAQIPNIESVEITAVPGQHLIPLPEGASYLGFIFARATTPLEAEAAVRKAHEALSFDIQTTLHLL